MIITARVDSRRNRTSGASVLRKRWLIIHIITQTRKHGLLEGAEIRWSRWATRWDGAARADTRVASRQLLSTALMRSLSREDGPIFAISPQLVHSGSPLPLLSSGRCPQAVPRLSPVLLAEADGSPLASPNAPGGGGWL